MTYQFNNTYLKIPDNDIEKIIKGLNVTKEQAIKIWLEDEEYLTNEEQEELNEKAKRNRITATIHQATTKDVRKKTQKERVQKDDPIKEQIIIEIYEYLSKRYENTKITNKTKLISFSIDNDNYELNLIRKRPTK